MQTAGIIFLVLWAVFFLYAMAQDSSEFFNNIVGSFILTFMVLVFIVFAASPFLAAFGLFG